jgi:hypothetical protein
MQREIGKGFSARAGYVGSRTIRVTNEVNIDAAPPGGATAGEPEYALFGRNVATTLHDPAFSSSYNIIRLGSPQFPRQHGNPIDYLRRTLARAAFPFPPKGGTV